MITERPYIYNFSKNDIRYVFLIDNPDRAGLRLQVKLMYANIEDDDFVSLYQFELKPDAGGMVYFYLQDYLNSLLQYVMPEPGIIFTNADSQARKFYIEFREIDADTPNPDWDISESANVAYVIKGGIERIRASRNNFFLNYFDTEKPFITWWPSKRFILQDEAAYLSILNTAVATTGYTINVHAVNTAGVAADKAIAFTQDGMLFHLLVSPVALDLASLVSGQLYYYEISVVSDAGIITGPYRFYVEHRPAYTFHDLVYFNSLGGLDFIRVKGDVEETVDRDYTETEGGFSLDDWNSTAKIHQSAQTGINIRDHWTGDAGWQKRKQEQLALKDIFVSEKIYYYLDGRWVPVVIVQKNQALGLTSAKIYSFPLEWTSSYTEQVYTPKSIALGIGYLCSMGGFAGAHSLPDGHTGVAYNYSFNLSGSAPFTLSDVDKPAWMTITMDGNTISFTGTPTDDDIENGISVSFGINNCSGSPLNFSDTIDVLGACVAVGIDVTPVLPDAVVGEAYSTSFDITGSAPFSLSSIVKPAWMTIAVTGNTIALAGTPAEGDIADGVDVSFTINNCSTDSLDFADTIDVMGEANIVWMPNTFISEDADNSFNEMNIIGPAGAVLTIIVSSFINAPGGTLHVDGSPKFLGDTFTVTLDGSGAGSFEAHLQATAGDGPMVVQFSVSAATAGDFSATGYKQTSKVFSH